MDNYCVYCHTSPSGKKYVGISCDPVRRWRNGRGYKLNYLFSRAIDKYGWDNFEHEILYQGLSASEAAEIETRLIINWDLTNPENGYNLMAGAGGPINEESRRRMSLSQMGNTNTLGHKLSDSTKRKISEGLKKYYSEHPGTMTGRKLTEEQIEKLRNRTVTEETRAKMSMSHWDVTGANNPSAKAIEQYTLNGEFVAEYPYAKAAA